MQDRRDRWHFVGQPMDDWPLWVRFTNFGYNGHSQIVIHQFEGTVIVNKGDVLVREPDGRLWIAD